MSRWGMGISASDEFADVVDEYFELFYYSTKPLAEIESEILHEYGERYSDFAPDDGVWHDVYFALAECGWKCGYIGKELFNKIDDIIKNNLDLAYLESLEASPQDLKQRAKLLDKFWIKINNQNNKVIQRKLKQPFINPFKTGDMFAYKYKGFYYSGVILQVRDETPEVEQPHKKNYHFCIAVADLQSNRLPTESEIINAEIRCAEWLRHSGLPRNGFTIIGNVANEISKDYINYLCSYKSKHGFGIYGNCYDIDLLYIFSPEFHCNNHLKTYEMNGKPIKYLFDTDNMLKTEQVTKLPLD